MPSLEPSGALRLRILGFCVPRLPLLLYLCPLSHGSRVPLHLAFEGPPPFPTGGRAPLTFLFSALSREPGSHPQATCPVFGWQWGVTLESTSQCQTLTLILAVGSCTSEV